MFSQLWCSPLCQLNVGDNMKGPKNSFIICIYVFFFCLFYYKLDEMFYDMTNMHFRLFIATCVPF